MKQKIRVRHIFKTVDDNFSLSHLKAIFDEQELPLETSSEPNYLKAAYIDKSSK